MAESEKKSTRMRLTQLSAFNFGATRRHGIDLKAAAAEFVGMTYFIVFSCGVAVTNGADDTPKRLMVAFAFGMSIMVLVYAINHHSGGQLNCAVTFSLVLGGRVSIAQGIANLAAQILGSMLGASILWGMVPCSQDLTTNLGSNTINRDYGDAKTLFAEFVATSLLCYVIWETAVSPKSTVGNNAAIAIGFAVFLAHLLLLPIDGTSINPTRSFGPAVISYWRDCPNRQGNPINDLWVMTVGPLLGGAFAALLQYPFGANAHLDSDSQGKITEDRSGARSKAGLVPEEQPIGVDLIEDPDTPAPRVEEDAGRSSGV